MSNITLKPITSGYNTSNLNTNFNAIKDMVDNHVLHTDSGQNTLYQDLDLNSNDILNAGIVSAEGLQINGQAVVPTNLGSVAPNSVGTTQVINGAITDAKITGPITGSKLSFIQSGTGAVVRDNQTKLREVQVSPEDYGALGNGVNDDTSAINAALAYLISQKGGTLQLQPSKNYCITSTILINSDNILIKGRGSRINHDGGSGMTPTTTITWKSPTPGVMITFETPVGTGQSKRRGGGLQDVILDGGDIATKGLYIHSWAEAEFKDIYVSGVTSIAYHTSCWMRTQLAEASDTQRCIFTRCRFRLIDTPAQQNAYGFWCSSDNPTGNANTSYNKFIDCYGYTQNGDGFRFEDFDNNVLESCGAVAFGTGVGQRLRGAYSNLWIHTGGVIKIEGIASGATIDSVDNVFFDVDQINGAQVPVADVNCTFQWHGHATGWLNMPMTKMGVGDTITNAQAAQGALGNMSALIRNGAQAGFGVTDGTATYSISQDSSHNLRILRNDAGLAGTLDLAQGLGVALRMASVGFNGTLPISKPTVTGSKGGNAALASLITALASYGLINDTTT